jgi:DNA polymerase III sliding clamp (beta) subunit (PCNA family)
MLKVTTERSELVRAIARVSHVTTRRAVNPLSATVKISTVHGEEASGLEFYAADGVGFASTTALADIEASGEIVVSALQLDRIVGVLPEGAILLQENDRSLSIASGKCKRSRIPLLAVPYPKAAVPDEHNAITLPSKVLDAALARIEVCREVGDRPFLQGVLLESNGSALVSFAVSNARVGFSQVPMPKDTYLPVPWSCFVPERLLRSIHDLCEESEEVTVSYEGSVYVLNEDTMVGCALPALPFPPHNEIIRHPYERCARVATRALVDALKMVSASSSDSGIDTDIWIANGELHLSSVASATDLDEPAEAVDAVEILEQRGTIPEGQVRVAVGYVRDVLRTIGEEVWIGVADPFIRLDAVEGKGIDGLLSVIIGKRVQNR